VVRDSTGKHILLGVSTSDRSTRAHGVVLVRAGP
jgi:hypothetical protein